MPRRREVVKREIRPDPKYGDILMAKFINYLVRRGKKSKAEKIVYGAIDLIEKKTGQNGLEVVRRASQGNKGISKSIPCGFGFWITCKNILI